MLSLSLSYPINMKHYLHLTIAIIALLIISCSKSEDTPAPTNSTSNTTTIECVECVDCTDPQEDASICEDDDLFGYTWTEIKDLFLDLDGVDGCSCSVVSKTGGGTSTCSDGIQNGDETGVDCGGSCPPCGGGASGISSITVGGETSDICGNGKYSSNSYNGYAYFEYDSDSIMWYIDIITALNEPLLAGTYNIYTDYDAGIIAPGELSVGIESRTCIHIDLPGDCINFRLAKNAVATITVSFVNNFPRYVINTLDFECYTASNTGNRSISFDFSTSDYLRTNCTQSRND